MKKPMITVLVARKMKGKHHSSYNDYTYANGYKGTFALSRENSYSKKKGFYREVLNIETERQLASFLYNRFSYGIKSRILVFAHGKKLYVFWRGEVSPDGYLFFKNEIDEKDDERIEREWNPKEAEDFEDVYFYEEMQQQEKKDLRDERQKKRYGFYPYLKASGQRGVLHYWDEPDEGLETKEREEKRKVAKKDIDKMSIDDLNNF